MKITKVSSLLSMLVLMLAYEQSFGQNDTLVYQRISVAFLPQYLINQAIRIDVEKPIGRQCSRLTLSPYLYAGMSSLYEDQRGELSTSINVPDSYGKDKVTGFGLEVANKYLLRGAGGRISNWYIAYGAGYHHIQLAYQDFVPTPFTDGELEYYEFTLADQQENINRLDLAAAIGVKLFLSYNQVLFLDLYAGPVYKNSWIDQSQGAPRDHEEPINFGFSGVTYRGGVALGVMLF